MTQNLTNLPDTILVDRVSQGETAAYGILYNRYLDPIYRFVFYQVANIAEAEDITEHIFYKTWQMLTKSRKKYKSQKIRTLLYRVSQNVIIDHYRTQKRSMPLDNGFGVSNPQPSTDTNGEGRQPSKQLTRAISKLEPKLQEVLTLRFVERLSHAETGEVLQLKPGQVRVLQYKGLKMVRELLESE